MSYRPPETLRRDWLQEADRNLASAREIATSRLFTNLPCYYRFIDDMDRASRLYRSCDLSLLARRVRANRDKCFKTLALKPEQRQERLTFIWWQFDQLNALDHFDYAPRHLGPK